MSHTERMRRYMSTKIEIRFLFNPDDRDYIRMEYWREKLKMTKSDFVRMAINNQIADLERK